MAKLDLYDIVYKMIVSPRHRDATITEVDSQVRELVKSVLLNNNKGFLLMGPVGSGKTSVLALALRAHLAQCETTAKKQDDWIPVHANGQYFDPKTEQTFCPWHTSNLWYGTHDKIVNTLRQWKASPTQNDGNDDFPPEMDRGRVFIDDFGRVYSDKSGWNLSLQEEYFDYLWRNNVRVYVTTNLTPAEFTSEIKSNGPLARVYDRLFDKSWVTRIVMTNESKRG